MFLFHFPQTKPVVGLVLLIRQLDILHALLMSPLGCVAEATSVADALLSSSEDVAAATVAANVSRRAPRVPVFAAPDAAMSMC